MQPLLTALTQTKHVATFLSDLPHQSDAQSSFWISESAKDHPTMSELNADFGQFTEHSS